MKKCLKISFFSELPEDFVRDVVQKNARALELEGSAQLGGNQELRIIICGTKEKVDEFIDLLHKKATPSMLETLTIEPFVHDRDYRGIFRVIE